VINESLIIKFLTQVVSLRKYICRTFVKR